MKHVLAILFLFNSILIQSQVSDFKNIDFTKADYTAKLYEGENLYNLPLLTHNLTSKLKTDVEKFRAIYRWICSNVKGDYYMYKKISRKRKLFKNDSISLLKWNKIYAKKVFEKLLKDKKTMCTGYAYLLKTMTNIANIECEIIDGYHRNTTANIETLSIPNHSWNAVKLNNKWYLVDATLASGFTNLSIHKFIFNYNDGYFLATPNLYSKTHFPLHKNWKLITKTTVGENDFTNKPIVYGAAFKYKFYPTSQVKLQNEIQKNEYANFNYTSKNSIDTKEIKIKIDTNTTFKNLDLVSIEKNKIKIKHQFKRKGIFDVHLFYKNEIIASCTVHVTN
ncbi:transglutaminase domain-containing protein [Polaribacter aestuariivivens]|uniref:transglutaminase domain-containing protein n=1 Tax=Polaribacter aestuariivivens TaxID=2304626 RepID=UPI003F499642